MWNRLNYVQMKKKTNVDKYWSVVCRCGVCGDVSTSWDRAFENAGSTLTSTEANAAFVIRSLKHEISTRRRQREYGRKFYFFLFRFADSFFFVRRFASVYVNHRQFSKSYERSSIGLSCHHWMPMLRRISPYKIRRYGKRAILSQSMKCSDEGEERRSKNKAIEGDNNNRRLIHCRFSDYSLVQANPVLKWYASSRWKQNELETLLWVVWLRPLLTGVMMSMIKEQ